MKRRREFPIKTMCRLLRVSRSGFYDLQHREESPRAAANRALSVQIREIFEQSDSTYGSPRITEELKAQGYQCSEPRVARLMQKSQLRSVYRRKFNVCTTQSNHDEPIAENIISQDFSAAEVGQKVGGDITYIQTDEGWLYLAVVLDFCSRKILGYAFSDSLESGLVCEALAKAVGNHRLPAELIHHSDRGIQYASSRYRMLLQSLGMHQSMSRSGNCYDNAITETFFGTLKVERVYRRRYRTREIAIVDVSDYIDRWYNPKRRHSSLGMVSPVEFIARQKLAA
jgi:putative transposase